MIKYDLDSIEVPTGTRGTKRELVSPRITTLLPFYFKGIILGGAIVEGLPRETRVESMRVSGSTRGPSHNNPAGKIAAVLLQGV